MLDPFPTFFSNQAYIWNWPIENIWDRVKNHRETWRKVQYFEKIFLNDHESNNFTLSLLLYQLIVNGLLFNL